MAGSRRIGAHIGKGQKKNPQLGALIIGSRLLESISGADPGF